MERAQVPPAPLPVLLESLLFVAEGPVPVARLAQAVEAEPPLVEAALGELATALRARGIRLVRTPEAVQLTSAPESAPQVERFLGLGGNGKLSPAALETLAIVAYRQPVTRAQIEAVRGVNAERMLRMLLAHGLIAEVGRLDTVGRPILYGTTVDFLHFFGLESLDQLPPLEEGASE